MPRARLVVPRIPGPGSALRLEGEEAGHARARRLRVGDAVVLVDGTRREARAVIERIGPAFLEVRIEEVGEAAGETLGPIHLLVAAVRSERLAWIAEKATELGAAKLTLVASERTQRFRASDSAAARLERVVREASKQAERADWPAVAGPLSFAKAVGAERGTRLILDPSGEPFPVRLPAGPTALLVGPEGGWTESELEDAFAAGWTAASLAAGKLRAETAAVAALTLARAALARDPH